MDERQTALIIPFPSRAPEPQPAVTAPAPERLSGALTSLATALAEQREAVAVWRSAVRDLAANMQKLNDTLSATKLTTTKTK